MKREVFAFAPLGILLACPSASANMGVPLVAVFLPPLWLSLIPVIALEAWAASRWLPISGWRAVSGSAIGNLSSTLIGVPLLWMLLALSQLLIADAALGLSSFGAKTYAVTVQAAWLIPYEEDLRWMIPVALGVLAVPAYVLSVLIEWRCMLPFVEREHQYRVLRVVAWANVASYALLAVLFLLALKADDRLAGVATLFEPVTGFFVNCVLVSAQWFSGWVGS